MSSIAGASNPAKILKDLSAPISTPVPFKFLYAVDNFSSLEFESHTEQLNYYNSVIKTNFVQKLAKIIADPANTTKNYSKANSVLTVATLCVYALSRLSKVAALRSAILNQEKNILPNILTVLNHPHTTEHFYSQATLLNLLVDWSNSAQVCEIFIDTQRTANKLVECYEQAESKAAKLSEKKDDTSNALNSVSVSVRVYSIAILANAVTLIDLDKTPYFDKLNSAGAVKLAAHIYKTALLDDLLLQAAKFLLNFAKIGETYKEIIIKALGSFGYAMGAATSDNRSLAEMSKQLLILFPVGEIAQNGGAAAVLEHDKKFSQASNDNNANNSEQSNEASQQMSSANREKAGAGTAEEKKKKSEESTDLPRSITVLPAADREIFANRMAQLKQYSKSNKATGNSLIANKKVETATATSTAAGEANSTGNKFATINIPHNAAQGKATVTASAPTTSSNDSNTCDHCGKNGAAIKLLVCGRCKSASYCSKECQTTAWKTHKTVCAAAK
jgi:hypothetical protein